jgi:hypothetical protein
VLKSPASGQKNGKFCPHKQDIAMNNIFKVVSFFGNLAKKRK